MSYSRKRPLEQKESEGDFKQKQEKFDEASCEESQGSSIASTVSKTTNELRVDNIKNILNTLKQGRFSSSMWYSLGIQLGLLPATLKDIEANHRSDVRRCLAECLETWLNKGDHCTWDSLEDALEKIEENTTAKEIKQRRLDRSFSDSQIPVLNVQDIATGYSDQLSQAHTSLSIMNSYDESFNDRDAQKTEVHSDKPFTEEPYNHVSLPDNQEAEITLKIHVKNTSGVAISLLKGGTIPLSLVCTIQAISSFRIISPVSNKERGEEGLNVSGGIGVERQNVNVDEIDNMDGEESCQHQETDDNLMKDDSQQQLVHYMLDNEQQEEHRQSIADQNQERIIIYRTSTCPQLSQQHSSQLKEEQRKERCALFSVSKEEYIPKYKYDEMKMAADALDTAYKEQKQDFYATKSELEKYKENELRSLEIDRQNKEEKRKKNERAQIKRKRTETLKHYVTLHLRGWEVISVKHLPSNISMEFKLKPSCTIPGRVDFSNDEELTGTVYPADLDELEKLRKQDH